MMLAGFTHISQLIGFISLRCGSGNMCGTTSGSYHLLPELRLNMAARCTSKFATLKFLAQLRAKSCRICTHISQSIGQPPPVTTTVETSWLPAPLMVTGSMGIAMTVRSFDICKMRHGTEAATVDLLITAAQDSSLWAFPRSHENDRFCVLETIHFWQFNGFLETFDLFGWVFGDFWQFNGFFETLDLVGCTTMSETPKRSQHHLGGTSSMEPPRPRPPGSILFGGSCHHKPRALEVVPTWECRAAALPGGCPY